MLLKFVRNYNSWQQQIMLEKLHDKTKTKTITNNKKK